MILDHTCWFLYKMLFKGAKDLSERDIVIDLESMLSSDRNYVVNDRVNDR
jgi:hypothetical protein